MTEEFSQMEVAAVTSGLRIGDFKDAQFMTAAEKLQVARAYGRFLRALTRNSTAEMAARIPAGWTKALYHHFSLHLGYIAHFNIHGFYEVQWQDPFQCRQNIANLRGGRDNLGFDMTKDADYGDLNKVMVKLTQIYGDDVVRACLSREKAHLVAARDALNRRLDELS